MKNKMIDGFNHALGRHGFDYDQMSEDVYLGTNMCCQFGFSRELLSKGVRADISLEELRVDAPQGVDYFVWLPTIDGEPPVPEKLLYGVQTLEFFKAQKVKVYLHCKNGHGRAPTLYAAYLIKMGMSVADALAFMKERRPGIHLTDAQVSALESFQRTL